MTTEILEINNKKTTSEPSTLLLLYTLLLGEVFLKVFGGVLFALQ